MQCEICLEAFPRQDMYCARGSQKKLPVKEVRDGCGHYCCQACMQVCYTRGLLLTKRRCGNAFLTGCETMAALSLHRNALCSLASPLPARGWSPLVTPPWPGELRAAQSVRAEPPPALLPCMHADVRAQRHRGAQVPTASLPFVVRQGL